MRIERYAYMKEVLRKTYLDRLLSGRDRPAFPFYSDVRRKKRCTRNASDAVLPGRIRPPLISVAQTS